MVKHIENLILSGGGILGIAYLGAQFNNKKKPPYTFQDFHNPSLHKSGHSFSDLSLIGTNLSTGISQAFSLNTTPTMEAAEAIRISMFIPLLFEAITQ